MKEQRELRSVVKKCCCRRRCCCFFHETHRSGPSNSEHVLLQFDFIPIRKSQGTVAVPTGTGGDLIGQMEHNPITVLRAASYFPFDTILTKHWAFEISFVTGSRSLISERKSLIMWFYTNNVDACCQSKNTNLLDFRFFFSFSLVCLFLKSVLCHDVPFNCFMLTLVLSKR